MMDPGKALEQYLAEVETFSRRNQPELARLLGSARAGDAEAKKVVVESMLFDVARIAVGHSRPRWARDVDKIQEANVVLLRAVDDPGVDDLLAALMERIPAVLDEIDDRGPESGV